jgi:hypothetical protein
VIDGIENNKNPKLIKANSKKQKVIEETDEDAGFMTQS